MLIVPELWVFKVVHHKYLKVVKSWILVNLQVELELQALNLFQASAETKTFSSLEL
jgi:hypothetical protein